MKGFNFRKGFNVLSEGTTPSVDDTAPVVTAFVIPSTSDSLTIPITDGRLNMGIWQGIYLCEFRNHGGGRKIVATVMGE